MHIVNCMKILRFEKVPSINDSCSAYLRTCLYACPTNYDPTIQITLFRPPSVGDLETFSKKHRKLSGPSAGCFGNVLKSTGTFGSTSTTSVFHRSWCVHKCRDTVS